MATNQNLIGGFQVNRGMLTVGAALTGLGALIGLTGTVIVGVALASAGRGWVRQLETPPGELAARTLQHARAASLAGLDAWRAHAADSAH
ncbi:hypothetical protein [Kitasatospora sp. GP82]|uniref:hypothetical protein n=1 Tax=Kitasatospora sp. GP82 TaxID=3035089 RepID=UPI002476C4B3|nr:hypothetical protein [Kitasatospora sp. GP82]MDH6124534.1 hypothetical protein [Kitasatospora sp. GP82]